MPSQTFANLPDEKKQRILDAAIEEFSSHTFNDASIARIIEKAEIPRGSFYQYFTDLKDLYKYIFKIIVDKKMVYLSKSMGGNDFSGDFFSTIKKLYTAGLQFAVGEPTLTKIGSRFTKEKEEFRKEIMGTLEGKTTDFYYDLLVASHEKGEIDPNVDLEMAAHIFTTMNLSLIDYFLAKSKSDDLLQDKEELLKVVDNMFYILTNGVKNKQF